jgi:hypothetical protein
LIFQRPLPVVVACRSPYCVVLGAIPIAGLACAGTTAREGCGMLGADAATICCLRDS